MKLTLVTLIDCLLRYTYLVSYLPERFHTFTNRPIGHTPSNPGVDMYQQPGPVGSQATSSVMSCHPSGNRAVNPCPACTPYPPEADGVRIFVCRIGELQLRDPFFIPAHGLLHSPPKQGKTISDFCSVLGGNYSILTKILYPLKLQDFCGACALISYQSYRLVR